LFDNFLIEKLETDHQALIELFNSVIIDGFNENDHEAVSRNLSDFKHTFKKHFISENKNLYPYLYESHTHKPTQLILINEFRLDLHDIASKVDQFCEKYESVNKVSEVKNSFLVESRLIAQTLLNRFLLEERDLHPLYKSNRKPLLTSIS